MAFPRDFLSKLDAAAADAQSRAMQSVEVDLTRPARPSRRFPLCLAASLALAIAGFLSGSWLLMPLLALAGGCGAFLSLRYRSALRGDNPLYDALARFIRDNGLYEEKKLREIDGDGRVLRSWNQVVSSIRMSAFRDADFITVLVHDDANQFSSRVRKLGDGLAALFARPLDRMEPSVTACAYRFRLRDDARLGASDTSAILSRDCCAGNVGAIRLSESLSWVPSKTPHALVCGGTGGGKSVFLYWLVAQALQLANPAEVFVCDPKNAELGSLSRVFGKERVGTTPGQIAGVVRRAVALMDARYGYMQSPERFRFGASADDYGLPPAFLIFDEFAGFRAEADKKVMQEVVDGLVQLILKARAANVFVILCLQQPRADSIPTDLRDNLGLRVSLGDLSAEGYRMAFGSCDGFTPQAVQGKGEGYIMLDGWNAPKPYAAPWVDFAAVDFYEVFRRLHGAAESRRSDPLAQNSGTAGETP